ncbi:hypothetical protein MPSEU_000403100 [Mayamaea pseudoterrestris]|nr:hypothetical protein MPSEU_000403100 [Mayamaea pseudoterrestris]
MSSAIQYARSLSGSNVSENLPPRTLARLSREVRDLHQKPPEGVCMIVDSDTGLPSNLGEIMAEMEGPVDTPYEGKFFLLKLVFGQDFPHTPPRGFFLTKLYHPNVDISNGGICVNTLKKDWTPDTSISHVLAVIRCLMIIPFPESSLNDEAGKLFMESYAEYAKRARLMADVHGRTESACAKDSDQQKKQPDDRVLKSSSDNPLRSNNTSKPMKKELSKKKSLKRL